MKTVRVTLLACLLCACGSPLTDSTYGGESLLTISGKIASLSPPETTADRYYIGVSWIGAFLPDPSAPVPYSFERAEVGGMRFPASFRMHMLEPPEEMVLWNGEIAMGVIQVLEDTEGDGRLRYTYETLNNPNGPVRGVVPTHFVLYKRGEGFSLIAGSATIEGLGDCPEIASVAPFDTLVTIRAKSDVSAVCWGGS